MVIYGLALLSACFFGGMLLGDILGMITGVGSNVGGVGFAMLALILVSSKLLKENKLSTKAQDGIMFWSAMYIPIVVAMTACQDVRCGHHGWWSSHHYVRHCMHYRAAFAHSGHLEAGRAFRAAASAE